MDGSSVFGEDGRGFGGGGGLGAEEDPRGFGGRRNSGGGTGGVSAPATLFPSADGAGAQGLGEWS